jgi:endonuclease YncB( thermonuclease family)
MKSGMPRFPVGDALGRQWKLWLLAVACAVIAFRLWETVRRPAPEFDFQSPGPYRVQRIEEDGSLVLDGGIPLRLIGIAFGTSGKESPGAAVDFLRNHTVDRELFLEFDRERRDRRGRILAYVTVDGLLLNEELIRAGLARIDVGVLLNTSMASRFRRAQEEAHLAERGIWHDESVTSR